MPRLETGQVSSEVRPRTKGKLVLCHPKSLNAVLEYVDHHKKAKTNPYAYAILGDGMNLKVKAFRLVQDAANAA